MKDTYMGKFIKIQFKLKNLEDLLEKEKFQYSDCYLEINKCGNIVCITY
jgi:hypothetical protein